MEIDDVLVEVSARHVHLTKEDFETLFGEGAVPEPRKQLTAPGLFACTQRVDVVGPRGTLRGVTILAPMRRYTQVEVSKTDARALGLTPPVRMSGDIEGTPGATLVGPCGKVVLSKGVIVARRHFHVPAQMAEENGLEQGQKVRIRVTSENRSLVFDDAIVRVGAGPFVHIDTDEGNAAGVDRKGRCDILWD